MKHLTLVSLALFGLVLAGCSGSSGEKGTIPPGTPPLEYEPARAYTPEKAPETDSPAADDPMKQPEKPQDAAKAEGPGHAPADSSVKPEDPPPPEK